MVEQVGHPLPGGRTRSVGKRIPTETVGTSGAWQKKLRADDHVWRNLGEFAVFGNVVGMIKYGRAGGTRRSKRALGVIFDECLISDEMVRSIDESQNNTAKSSRISYADYFSNA